MLNAAVGGLVLTAAVSGALAVVWGRQVLAGAVAFGLLATGIQVVSTALVRPVVTGEFKILVRRWGIGMGLRIGGVVAFAVAAGLRGDLFPPLPTALGYLGVLIPLLFMEIRLLK